MKTPKLDLYLRRCWTYLYQEFRPLAVSRSAPPKAAKGLFILHGFVYCPFILRQITTEMRKANSFEGTSISFMVGVYDQLRTKIQALSRRQLGRNLLPSSSVSCRHGKRMFLARQSKSQCDLRAFINLDYITKVILFKGLFLKKPLVVVITGKAKLCSNDNEMVSEVHNIDCNVYMKSIQDKYFELAIVDPPYGIDINMNMGRQAGKAKVHEDKMWDSSPPTQEYFDELRRVSCFQIIWGGNYFDLPKTGSWLFWDKMVPDGVSFASGELAWTSGDKALRMVRLPYSGFNGSEGKIHPTQKPVKLYKWILSRYAKAGDKIFDSHVGSGSSRIACYDMGFDYYGCELDKDYFDAAEKRFQNHISQLNLFQNGSTRHPPASLLEARQNLQTQPIRFEEQGDS